MSSDRATKPAALRLTAADRERLLAHGGTVRAAVLTLLDTADEHASCPPPKGSKRRGPVPRPTAVPPSSTRQQVPTMSTRQQPVRSYEVVVAGEVVYRTVKKDFAEQRAKMERARRPADTVEVR